MPSPGLPAVARRRPRRELLGTGEEPGSVSVRTAASPHAETALIVDALRRAHLIDGVPWSQMAVIVRSVRQSGAALTRAMTAAGVPVVTPPPGVPPAEQPAARAMLTVLAAAEEEGLAVPQLREFADRAGRSGLAAATAPGAAPRRSQPAPARLR
jgi:hypothetical protein